MTRTDLKCCEASPRIDEDGVIHLYPGDTAHIEFEIELYRNHETTGQEIIVPITENDVIHVCFKNRYGQLIHEFEFTNVQNNTITICITEEITKKFKKGTYTYCVHVNSINIEGKETKTIAYENKMVVD